MCRNIKTLFNFEPPANEQEIRAAALQFVRKVSGSTHPSRANQSACDKATDEISTIVGELLTSLVTRAAPKNRDSEAAGHQFPQPALPAEKTWAGRVSLPTLLCCTIAAEALHAQRIQAQLSASSIIRIALARHSTYPVAILLRH